MKNHTISNVLRTTLLCGVVALAVNSRAAEITKADNTDTLDLGTAWVGGLAPTDADVARFDNTLTASYALSLGADTNYAGLKVVNPAGYLSLSGGTLGLGASGIDMSGSTVSLTLSPTINVLAAQTWTVAASQFLTNNGSISGATPITISGPGTVVWVPAATPTHNGGVVVDGGSLFLNNAASYGGIQLTTNSVIFRNGGHVRLNAGSLFIGGTNHVPSGHSGLVTSSSAANGYNARFFGPSDATLNVCAPGFLTQVSMGVTSAQFNDFFGTVRVASGGSLRFSATSGGNFGGTNTTFDVLGTIETRNGLSVNVSQLTGNGTVSGPSGANGTATWNIGTGTKGLDSSFSGVIRDNNSARFVAVTKVGSTKLSLSGHNTYSGNTTINGGEFVGVTSGSCSNTSFTVNSSNITMGAQVLVSGQRWTCNNLLYAATTTTNTLKIDFGGTLPSTTVAPLLVRTNIGLNTNVNLLVVGANLPVGTYPLVQYGGAITNKGFAGFALLPIAGVTASLADNVANKTIDLVVSASADPLSWNTGSGTWDIGTTANWTDANSVVTPYTETAGLGEPVVFDDALSGGSPITVTLNTNVVPSGITVSGTKNWTISGTGAIGGGGAITKSGSGTLTLGTANTLTGQISINGGVVNFSALNNLGSTAAPITFGGGTLQYAGANTADISGHTVTIGAGGATIDVGVNNVTYAARIGNGGVGGLTKAGSGLLTLSGANNYTGNTTVSAGTLALAAGAGISNSPVITVASSAALDVLASGLALNAGVAQVLTGSGTVTGAVTAVTGTTIIPGTSPGTLTVGALTLNGGTNVFDMDPNPANRDKIVANGNLTLNSGTVVLNITAPLTNGTYNLITYSGTLSGVAANLVLVGSQAGKVLLLDDSIPGQLNLKVQTAGGKSIVWAGTAADWDLEISSDWYLNGTANPTQYVNGDLVRLDDSGLAQANVNLTAAHLPGGVVVSNTAGDYTFSSAGSGRISGAVGLRKDGASTLTVLTDNNNSGATVINAGTVAVGNGGTTGSLGSGNVTNNGALNVNRSDTATIAGAVTGTGTLTHSGTGTLILGNNNNYTGGTTISSGTMQVGAGGAAGTLEGTSSVNNGGLLTLNSSATWTLGAGITGGGSLSKEGSGTVILSGANSFSGGTTNAAGTLKVGSASAIPSTTILTVRGGTFDLNSNNVTVAQLEGAAPGVIQTAGVTNTLRVGSSGFSSTYSGQLANGSGALALYKEGAGTLTLTAVANSYSGGSTVAEGQLTVAEGGAAGAGPITLSNATTLFLDAPGSSLIFMGNNVTVVSNATATLNTDTLGNGFSGNYSSQDTNGILSVIGPCSFSAGATKQFQGFLGVVQVGPAGTLRFSSTTVTENGGDNTTFEVEGTLQTRSGTGSGPGVSLGALSGSSGSIGGPQSGAGNSLFVIGAKGLSTTFGGSINGNVAGSANSITKVGAGTLTLTGSLNYVGNTTVSNGVLALGGIAELDESPALFVGAPGVLDVSGIGGTLNLGNLAAQSLSGNGTINGSVTAVGTAATVNPGAGVGTLTITNVLTLAANSEINMQLNRTNSPATNDMIVAAAITGSGTLTVTNLGPDLQTGDKFKLFNVAVSGFTTVNLPVSNAVNTIAYAWTNKLAVDGSIEVLSGYVPAPPVATNATNITFSVGGGNLNIGWPEDHIGWTLQTQTNSRTVGLTVPTNTWFNVPNSTITNLMEFPVDPANPTVFFRLFYVIP